MGSPWPFAAWSMDVIGPIEPAALNGHHFILVAINYFIKWVEESTYKAVTKKVVADFVRNNIVCSFGILESIIIDNVADLNSDLMREIFEKCKIVNRNSTAYRPQMNGAVEAKLDDAEWVRVRQEQLMLIDEKRMNAICHGQLYQNRMASAFGKRVKPRQFTSGKLVLKKIIPHQEEAKGKYVEIRQLIQKFVHSKLSTHLIRAPCTNRTSASPIEVLFRHDYGFNQSLLSGDYVTL
nr:uncharacterized protein LOC117276688 [Nicotiana tomentosiformis]